MSEKTNGAQTETCGRCGYLKFEHVQIKPNVLMCPTALFLKDELQALMSGDVLTFDNDGEPVKP